MSIEPKLESFVLEEIDSKFFSNSKFKKLQSKIVQGFNKLISQIPFERSNTSGTFQSDLSSSDDASDGSIDDNLKINDYSYITINDYSFERSSQAI